MGLLGERRGRSRKRDVLGPSLVFLRLCNGRANLEKASLHPPPSLPRLSGALVASQRVCRVHQTSPAAGTVDGGVPRTPWSRGLNAVLMARPHVRGGACSAAVGPAGPSAAAGRNRLAWSGTGGATGARRWALVGRPLGGGGAGEVGTRMSPLSASGGAAWARAWRERKVEFGVGWVRESSCAVAWISVVSVFPTHPLPHCRD